ncbi:zinc finger, CCHC-type containing protein, partial [Tanacetum coccineum]
SKTKDQQKGIDSIFVGYAEHSKAYRFYVIEPNDFVSINSIIESRDAIFDENCFSSIPRPKDVIPNLVESQRDDHSDDVPSETPEPRKDKRVRKAKSIEEDPRTYDKAMQSQDVLSGKKQLMMRLIFKRKMKVDGTIDKFKARLVIQGFRQKEGIDYFDTYVPVARITTIRLLLALAAIHNLVIHQMDVKTTFLNGDLDEEVYMKQPEEFVMPCKEHKVCKLVKLLYGLKQAPKHSGKGVIICLYVDDMLIFGIDQNQVDKTKKFLSSKFLMKDMGEADVILGSKIKQKLKPNTGKPVDQLEYSRAVGCLMYAITSTKPDIAYAIDRLSRFTSRQHWQAITKVFKYLNGTMNYGLSYVGYLTVLEGYSDASWINHVEDSSSTNGWVFLLGKGAISWASKKQTCITSSTMESEFVALAAAGKEAKWLRNLIHEIPIWPKPIAPIFIHCDSAATLAKAYSQMYNGKSRHLGVRHSMIKELIMNGVIFIEFVRSQQNLADQLTKGLAKDLVNNYIQCGKLIARDWNMCIYLPDVQELKGPPMYSNGLTGSIVTTPRFSNIWNVYYTKTMAEEDALLVDNVEGGLCVTTPMPKLLEDATLEVIRIRAKWEKDDYICTGHILNEDSSSKKFLISNFNNYKMVDSRPVMEQYSELLRILGQYTKHGLKMDESISVSSIIDKLPPSWKDFKHTLKRGKDDLSLVQLGSHLCIEESLRAQDSDKGKGKEVARPFVNMTEEGKNKNNKQNKVKKCDFKEHGSGSGSNKKPKWECWKCGKTRNFKRDCRSGNKKNTNLVPVWKGLMQLRVEDRSVLYMGDEHFAPIHGKGSVALEFSSGKIVTLFNVLYVPKLRKNLVSGPVLNKCGYKQVYESDKYILSKCGVFVGFGYYNNGMFMLNLNMLNLNKVPDDSDSVYMSSSTVVNSSLWHARLGHVYYKKIFEMSKDDLIHAIGENPKKCTTCMLMKITRKPF